ncbi:tetratricopeptide repeat protein [Herbaspirillum sp. RV1423]|uniref:tetratricopeptide repeat protein n=1 Tax=Herbaspirillum sp. RV1423 TaxID=1443993 RepID=UPI0005590CFC|nr:tetratricopeptide repeat protein [Herbaspirillum sp. RV1423]
MNTPRHGCLQILVIAALLLGSGTVHAARDKALDKALDLAQAALAAKDYKKAYALYLRQNERSGLAQFVVGMFYQEGWGRPRDPAVACGWFEKAAQRKVPTAENNWADCLAQGIGRPPDIPSALKWYELAAQHGHLLSACNAADYYIQGKGVPQDVQRGIDLCTSVAQASSPPAMLRLADYYEQGNFVQQDLPRARAWYQEAAALNNAEAQYHLGVMLAQGEGGPADLQAGVFWLETAAGAGYVPAYLPTALLYAKLPVEPDTGMLSAEHLAKAYLWNSAAKATVTDAAGRAAIERLDGMIGTVMPAAWRAQLDQQVAAHLAQYAH